MAGEKGTPGAAPAATPAGSGAPAPAAGAKPTPGQQPTGAPPLPGALEGQAPSTKKVTFRRADGTVVELDAPADAKYVRKAKWPKKDGTFEERDLDEDEVYGNYDLRRHIHAKEQTAKQVETHAKQVLTALQKTPMEVVRRLPQGTVHHLLVSMVQDPDPRIQAEVAQAFAEVRAEADMPEDQRLRRDLARQQQQLREQQQAWEAQQRQAREQQVAQQNQIRIARSIHLALQHAGMQQPSAKTIHAVAKELETILPDDWEGGDVHPVHMQQAVQAVTERERERAELEQWRKEQAAKKAAEEAAKLEEAKRAASQPPPNRRNAPPPAPAANGRMTLDRLREERERQRAKGA